MARFIADIQGARGAASRIGHATTGIHSHTRGWSLGVDVVGQVVNGQDTFSIHATSGSNGGTLEHLATITRDPATGELRVTTSRTAIR